MRAIFESETDSWEVTRKHFIDSLRFPVFAISLLWLIYFFLHVMNLDPGAYGIMSRRIWGLWGIFTGPLVHGSIGHLASNSVPLFVLLIISHYFYRKVSTRAFWIIYFLTGVSVWLFARPVSHIGASGVVYGLVAFVFWNGIFRRSLRSVILALIVVVSYSGMFMGILPDQEGISWESHLLGSIAGILTSFIFKGELEDGEAEQGDPFAEERLLEKQLFLPPDSFDKTKAQRLQEAEEEAQRRALENNFRLPPFWNQDSTW